MKPQCLVGQAACTDNHRRRDVGRLEVAAPLRDQLTVAGKHDCIGPIGRDVHRDLPTTVVFERLGDELSSYRLVIHGYTSMLKSRHSGGGFATHRASCTCNWVESMNAQRAFALRARWSVFVSRARRVWREASTRLS